MPKKGGFAKKKTGPKRGFNREATELERKFVVEYLCNPQSPHYCNPINAAIATGYKGIEGKTAYKVGAILVRPAVIKLITSVTSPTVATLDTMSRLKYEQELIIFLQRCKDTDDRTNWKGALELYGKFTQYLTDKITITTESMKELSDERQSAIENIARLTLLQSNPVDAQFVIKEPLQGNSEPVALPEGIQDVVSIEDCNDHNNDDIDKSSNDKDLQNQ